ncbi:MAG: hypothetical protein WAL66_08960 [Nitrososphaeraceae archaeon]
MNLAIRKYIDERLPEEYEKCLIGLTAILREAWNTSQQTEDKREKVQALSLAKECYSMKLDLLTNATVVDDAIRFVSERQEQQQQQQQSNTKARTDSPIVIEKESREEQESDNTTTINQVF